MNPLNILFGQLANSVQQHSSPDTPGPAYDSNPILGALSGIFGQHAQQTGQQFDGYNPNAQYENNGPNIGGMLGGLLGGGGGLGGMLGGLGGGQQNSGGGVQSSDADPYGDPENQGGASYGNVQSSDADPYGDPENGR
ncbi:hypothetical protein B1R32_101211 [Abditibacterium utsteinense]|uniref:Uncharacterized protein n=1 Tax=Abditibacterium utsteinense TaxID=1960156 RepID=A0A2S8SXJ2_9BACT|nr:hypothetical protein [Abditibacterium utsteinense]PQV65469.1 hypothetical protein B1R32_101211 [Abditibacterium utsteinense]